MCLHELVKYQNFKCSLKIMCIIKHFQNVPEFSIEHAVLPQWLSAIFIHAIPKFQAQQSVEGQGLPTDCLDPKFTCLNNS